MAVNTIIGCATGYDWAKLWPFVVSARKHAPDCRIVMLTHGNDADTMHQLEEHGVCLVPVDTRYPWMPAYFDAPALLKPWPLPAPGNMHVVCWRFAALYCYLRTYGHECGRVCLTDVRDVLFSGDVFDFNWDENRACLVNECEAMTHGACPYNDSVMRKMDPFVADQLVNTPIICSGVIIGNPTPIMVFLEKMLDCFTWAPTHAMLTDQVIARWVIEKFPDTVKVYGSTDTLVRHVGYWKPNAPPFSGPPKLDGAALVHQADRFPILNAELIARLT